MGRSQRHMVIIQGTDAAGKGLSEKQPAPRYVNQFANSQAFSVWSGPAGGPLQGSSMVGFPPTLIPPPTGTFNAELLEGEGEFTDPGQFNLSGNPIYMDLPETNEPGPSGDAPTITSITPAVGTAGTTTPATIVGTNFTDPGLVFQDGTQIVSNYVSATEISCTVPGAATPQTVQITVQADGGTSNAVPFEVVETVAEGRSLPIGPTNLLRVEDVDTGIALYVPQGSDIQIGDTVLVEATGNTGVNGSYEVLSVSNDADEMAVVVDNTYELAAPIEAKGRVTVTA